MEKLSKLVYSRRQNAHQNLNGNFFKVQNSFCFFKKAIKNLVENFKTASRKFYCRHQKVLYAWNLYDLHFLPTFFYDDTQAFMQKKEIKYFLNSFIPFLQKSMETL